MASTLTATQVTAGVDRTRLRSRPAKPVTLPLPIGAAPADVRARLGHVAAIFALDDSGSMYGESSDGEGVRYAAAKSLVALLDQGTGARVGVIHWGTTAPKQLVLPLTELTRLGKRTITASLTIPPTLGGNCLPAALDRAIELLQSLRDHDIPLIFVITDGIEDITDDITVALDALPPRSVHVLLVDPNHGCPDNLEAAWRQLPIGGLYRLEVNDTGIMARQLAHITADTLGLTLPNITTTKEANQCDGPV